MLRSPPSFGLTSKRGQLLPDTAIRMRWPALKTIAVDHSSTVDLDRHPWRERQALAVDPRRRIRARCRPSSARRRASVRVRRQRQPDRQVEVGRVGKEPQRAAHRAHHRQRRGRRSGSVVNAADVVARLDRSLGLSAVTHRPPVHDEVGIEVRTAERGHRLLRIRHQLELACGRRDGVQPSVRGRGRARGSPPGAAQRSKPTPARCRAHPARPPPP